MGEFLYRCCISYKRDCLDLCRNPQPDQKKATMAEQEETLVRTSKNQTKMCFILKKTQPYNLRTEEEIDTTVLMSSIDPCVLDVSLSKLLNASSPPEVVSSV